MLSATTANPADADVTTGLKAALLKNAALKGLDIKVITTKGNARLVGVVDTQSQLDTANKVARGTAGIRSIHDEPSIKK